MLIVSCGNKEPLVINADDQNLKLNNGVLEYHDDPFTGKLESTYANSAKHSEVFYYNGLKEGGEKQWYGNGILAMERFYHEGVKVGVHKAWWSNGIHKFVYYFNDKGEHHGNLKEWDITGLLIRDFNYKNGKESGAQKMWKDNGEIKSNYVVVNGERFGLIGLKKCYTVTVDKDEIK
ncbi:hypothetical protein FUA24_02225 [Seonamhaeicola marinus]|uniref:Toxin-antitoxin system YwqK family antitoxin n=1 Tax=Seonamhaeicola marinus TaxID=1912246 RepID=A0A5D0J7M2_9FLAO|nr:hypothetical protein FUA24_02225 [Seonamhaeicola marinus]